MSEPIPFQHSEEYICLHHQERVMNLFIILVNAACYTSPQVCQQESNECSQVHSACAKANVT